MARFFSLSCIILFIVLDLCLASNSIGSNRVERRQIPGMSGLGGLGGLGGQGGAGGAGGDKGAGSNTLNPGKGGALNPGGGTGLSGPTPGCKAYMIISARGTGEMQTSPIAYRGFLRGVLSAVKGGGNYEVKYPASVDYLNGPKQGARDANRYVNNQLTKCPQQVFLWIGYSEGAMVVTHAVATGKLKPDRTIGLVLYGNPYHSPNAPQNKCSGNSGVGIGKAIGRAMPGNFIPLTYDCCLQGDMICQTIGTMGPHVAYGAQAEKGAIRWAVAKIKAKLAGQMPGGEGSSGGAVAGAGAAGAGKPPPTSLGKSTTGAAGAGKSPPTGLGAGDPDQGVGAEEDSSGDGRDESGGLGSGLSGLGGLGSGLGGLGSGFGNGLGGLSGLHGGNGGLGGLGGGFSRLFSGVGGAGETKGMSDIFSSLGNGGEMGTLPGLSGIGGGFKNAGNILGGGLGASRAR